MSNDEEPSSMGEPQNMALVINVMQQQFEQLNMVLGEFRERMDKHDTVISNLPGGQPNENEVEIGSEEDCESEIEVGKHRPRGVRHGRGYRRNNLRGRNKEDGNLGNIKMNIPPFQGNNDPEAYLEWEKKVELIFETRCHRIY